MRFSSRRTGPEPKELEPGATVRPLSHDEGSAAWPPASGQRGAPLFLASGAFGAPFPLASATSPSIALSSVSSPGLPTHLLRSLPCASIRKIVGQPLTPQFDGISPCVPSSPQEKLRQVICSSTNSFFFSARVFLPSLLTPISAKGSSFILPTSDRSCGNMARQGPHQYPQKSSITTLPRYSESLKSTPSRSLPTMSGATAPIFRCSIA